MTTKTTAPAPVWREIAVADIATDGTNPRTLFATDGDAGLADLAASITAQGLLQPVVVRADADAQDGQPPYLLVAGERRLRAIRDVLHRPHTAPGIPGIPHRPRPAPLPDHHHPRRATAPRPGPTPIGGC